MPCYQTSTLSVEFHAKHRTLLDAAIESLGWQVKAKGQKGVIRR